MSTGTIFHKINTRIRRRGIVKIMGPKDLDKEESCRKPTLTSTLYNTALKSTTRRLYFEAEVR